MPSPIHLRAPTSCTTAQTAASTSTCTIPTIPQLTSSSPWHIIQTTLPLWKDKRNVHINYAAASNSRLDDTVVYQTASGSTKTKTVHGIDTPSGGDGVDGVWEWRGKSWLKIASSHWEVLGCSCGGEEERDEDEEEETAAAAAAAASAWWVVVFFEKTLFTPAGLDILSPAKTLDEAVVARIILALGESEDERVRELSKGFFAVEQDG